MKQLFKTLTVRLIWLIIGLYLTFIILIQLPSIQQFAGSEVEKILSERLGTKVNIESIKLGMFNRVIIDGAVIYDQHDCEMLKARRLSVKISIPSLLNGKISISSAQIFATHFNLYKEDIDSKHNFQFVLDSLASKDTTSSNPLDLRINSLIIRHSSIAYDKHYIKQTPGIINPSHIKVQDISAHIILKALQKDSVNLNIKRLAFKEQSGLNVNKMSAAFRTGKQGCVLNGLSLRMPQSYLNIDSIVASFATNDLSIDLATLKFHGVMNRSVINVSDLAFIKPSMKDINDSISLHTLFDGSGSILRLNSLHAQLPGSIISAFTDNNNGVFSNLGMIELDAAGEIDTLGNGNLGVSLTSDVGGFLVDVSIEDKQNISGQILTDSIRMNRLFPDDKFGVLKLQTQFSATLDSAMTPHKATFKGIIPAADYNNYRYHDLAFEGSYFANSFSSIVSLNGPDAAFVVDASLSKHHNIYKADISTDISHFAPQALNLSSKWGGAVFGGHLKASLTGSRLENIVGQVEVSNLSMESPERSYALDKLILDSRLVDDEQIVTMNSDFGHMRINGKFNYSTLPQSLINILHDKLPTIPGIPQKTINTNNRFQLYCALDRTDWLESLLGVPLQLQKRTTIVAKIDDNKKEMYANCIIPNFFYDNKEYRNAIVAITSPDDTLSCNISVSQIRENGIPFMLQIGNKAANNKLTTNINFDNNADKRLIGSLSASTLFSDYNGISTAHIDILPSKLNINDEDWTISPAHFTYSDKNISVDKFEIANAKESITISGKASEDIKDQLSVTLRNIDVNYVLNLINFRSVKFDGQASGRAFIRAPFSNMDANAKLMVNNFKFQDGRMGVLDANVKWDNAEKIIKINAVADDGPDAMTFVDGYVSPSPGYIDLKIRAAGTHLDFMESFTNSFTNNVEGHVYGDVNLVGPLKTINLVGDLVANGSMGITPLNTKYYLRNDTLKLIPDEIQVKPSLINDAFGNKATLSGYIRHKNLTKLTYDLFVNTDNLLVYDFKEFGDEVFCGTVFGGGNVEIHGRSKELKMIVDLTTNENSDFTYNVSTPDAIIDQKFINWNTKHDDNVSNSPDLDEIAKNMSGDTEIEFKINCTPDATVKFLMDSRTNDCISLHGSGTFNALYHNKKGFNMYGTYTVDRGTYTMTIQDIIKKNFTFKQGGYLKFGGDPSQAQLNLQAVHTVNSVSLADLNVGNSYSDNTTRVNCLLNITGAPFELQLDYGIELPTASSDQERNIRSVIQGEDGMKQQVIYLLGFGRFMPQMTNNEAYQDPNKLDQTTQAMQGLLSGTLSTQINNLLSSAINNNNWNFGANISTGDEGWHNAEYEGLLNGRLLNNRLIINGQFGYRDNATTANSSFIGDFDISYLLVPSGNLALKVYNQTNDRYFTKSSLNTQGIGFIIKKDFTNLGELFGRKRKKKSINE